MGIINTSTRLNIPDELLNLTPVNSEITGSIVSIPQGIQDGKPKFFFKVEKIEFEGIKKDINNEIVLVTANTENFPKDIKIYNSAILTGRLSIPFKAGNPSQFDYGNYLRNHKTNVVFYAKNIELNDSKKSFKETFLQKISNYRENVINIHSKYLKSPNLELLGGIVFGDDAISPSKDLKESFAKSGLLHILAASGMNVAFIFGFFFWVSTRLRLNYRLKILLGMIMVIIYSLMTGLGASIIRAACMLIFVLIGKLIDRDTHSISLLSFVALLMLIYNPLFINDVGFQLSFIVTFGILLMTPVIIRFNNKIVDYIIGTIAIPIIAQLWVIPIQIFYFSNISIYSIFANIMSVPILGIISFGGFITALLSCIKPFADIICKTFDFILNPLLTTLVNISDFWGFLPNSTYQTSHPNIFQILIYYSILLIITGLMYKDVREKYVKPLSIYLVSSIIILLITLIPIKNSDLEIITFDVGNADCFLIKTPANEYIMIDTGKTGYKGGKSQAEIIILKYLKDKGIKTLDNLILTHFDNDHCGGATDILNKMTVNKVYVNSLNHDSYAANTIYKTAQQKNVKLHLAKNNEIIYHKDGLKLTNLLGKCSDSDNENSIITLLEYNNFKMLFTGDVSSKALYGLIKLLPPEITVLKVPHHGAIDSLNKYLITYLKPKFSIISVGENKFGHPSQYTLEMLKESNLLRTDINNSILLKINKNKIDVFTFDLNKKKYILYK